MKISCTRDNLFQALSVTSHLTSKNVNLPVLQNVLIKAEGNTIRFSTTNLEIAIHCLVRGKVEEEGETTIPSRLFFDFVSLLPSGNVIMKTEGDHLGLSCGSHKTKMNGLPASEFPLIPIVKSDWSFQAPLETFKGALSRVLFAVATNEARPELTGVCAQISDSSKGSVLTIAATDSYRLAEEKILLDEKPQGVAKNSIIPARTLAEANRIFSVFKDDVESPSQVTVQMSGNQVVFRLGTSELISRTIEGTYPDYRQIIPNAFQTRAVVDREDFGKSVKAASLFAKTGLYDIGLSIDAARGEISVQSTDGTRGENVSVCTAQVTGKDNRVTVNYRYLLDGLAAISHDQISFEMIDASNPCLIRSANPECGYMYLVMPIKQ